MQEVVRHAGRLYSLPDICLRLQELIARQASVFEIADLVALDPALTARLLRLANSSFYAFPSPVDTVSRAVRLIGTNELYNLALATSAVSAFARIPRHLLDMDAFWDLSVQAGLIARQLGKRCGFRQGERLFTAGLLHQIGLLAIIEQHPDEVSAVLKASEGRLRPDLEQQQFGFTLASCGAELMKLWRLPPALTEVVRHQHDPEAAGEELAAAMLIHIGTRAAGHLHAGFSPELPSDFLADIDDLRLQAVQADRAVLQQAMTEIQSQALQVLNIIAPGASVVV